MNPANEHNFEDKGAARLQPRHLFVVAVVAVLNQENHLQTPDRKEVSHEYAEIEGVDRECPMTERTDFRVRCDQRPASPRCLEGHDSPAAH